MSKNIINNKNAYVVLQIDKNEYISASLVLANSLRKTCITNDLIIMVNNKISQECKNLLLKSYDKMIEIEKISNKMSINKLLAMQLTEYEKIIIVDADSIIFKNISFLFDIKTPALIGDNKDDNKRGTTGIIVIEPNKNKLEKIKKIAINKDLTAEDILRTEYNKINKIDRSILDSNKYNKKSYGIQYNKDKPFILESDTPLEERIKLDYFNMWYYYFRNIINKDESLSENRCIASTIELSKNYLPNMINFMLENEEILKNRNDKIIKKLYKLKEGLHINNYHTNISIEYNDKELAYNMNDYVLKDIITYYNITRGKNIKIYETIKDLTKHIDEIENFLNMYIRVKSNTFIIIDIKEIDKEFNEVDNKEIIYTKEIISNGLIMKNIMFDIDNRYTYKIRLEKYKKYINKKKYKLRLLIYENKANNDYIYNEYRDKVIMLNDIQSKIRTSSILLNDETLKKYSEKELGMIEENNEIKENLMNKMIEETIKKWIYNNYSVKEIEKIIVNKNNKKITIHECFRIKKTSPVDNIEIVKIKKDKNSEYLNKIINEEYYEKDGIKYMKN